MEEQKMEIKKGRKNFWYIFDVCLFGFCVLLFLIQWDPIEIVGYLIGYFGRSTGEVFLLWLFCWPMYVLVLKQAYTVCLSMDSRASFFGATNLCQPAATA